MSECSEIADKLNEISGTISFNWALALLTLFAVLSIKDRK